MIAAWMVYGILTSAVVGIAALAMERICQARRIATRWVWLSALIAPCMFALFGSGLLPQVRIDTAGAIPQEPAHMTGSMPPAISDAVLPRLEIAEKTSTWNRAAGLDDMLLTGWAVLSGLLLASLIVAWVRLHQRARSWRQARIAQTEIVIADEVGPAVFGIVRSRIVAPAWLLHANETTQRAVLAHESQHIAARDPLLLAASMVLVVLLPWNLPMWWQWRRLRFATEVDCDARVLRAGANATEYGTALLDVAVRRAPVSLSLLSPAMHDADCALERRIRLLLAPGRLSRLALVGLTLCTATLAVAAGQITSPKWTSSPQASVERANAAAPNDVVRNALGRELLYAAQRGEVQAIAEMLRAGAPVDHVEFGDGTPLIVAARRGDRRLAALLLQHGASSNLACEGDGNPLIMAASGGDMNLVTMLLEHGADVNGIVIGDETPLINAARQGHLPVVRLLVEHGADVKLAVPADRSPNAEIRSPLSEAIKYGHRDTVAYLRNNGAA